MPKTLYGTYKMLYTEPDVRYSPSYSTVFNDILTNIQDLFIPGERYDVQKLPPEEKVRFFSAEYEGEKPTNIPKVGAEFSMTVFDTPLDAILWLDSYTDLVETSPGVFLVYEAYYDSFTKTQYPAQYLVIN